jgi:putative intracellular protease/amidase
MDNYGGNYGLNLGNFEQYGWNITIVGATETVAPCANALNFYASPSMTVDMLIGDVTDVAAYDVLAILPASYYADAVRDEAVLNLIASAAEAGLVIYAPCGGVRLPAAAGILEGVHITGDSVYRNEYEEAGAVYVGEPSPPVIDDIIVTGVRGLYYNRRNSEAVAVALEMVRDGAPGEAIPVDTHSDAAVLDGALWARTIGGANADGGRAIQATDDGGFVIAGYTASFGAGNTDAYLIKTDAEGNVLWSAAYGGPGWEVARSVAQTGDGGYILAGYTTSFDGGSRDAYLVRTDAEGNMVWSTSFGGPGIDTAQAVMGTEDGGFVFAGTTDSFGAGETDIYLIRTDAEGNELWSETFGGVGPETGTALATTQDGGFVIGGATGSASRNSDVYLVKVDADGNEVWTRSLGDLTNYDWGNAIRATRDGGFIIVGEENHFSVGALMEVQVIKTDADGNELWRQIFSSNGYYDYANGVYETDDGGYVIAGSAAAYSENEEMVSVIRIDAEGNLVASQTFGGPGAYWGGALCAAPDGGYVIAGHTDAYGAGSYDVWMVRVSE